MNLIDYLGKFHPLAVHLPIGILAVFIVLTIFMSREKLSQAISIIKLIILASALSATFSAVSGYILSLSGDYEPDLLRTHQILGIALTLVNWTLFFGLKSMLNLSLWIYRTILTVLSVLLIMTGHAGGSLTHGSNFLNPPSPEFWFSSQPAVKRQITLNNTIYEAVSVILEEKCYTCHGKSKKKGKLRLDTKEGLLQGGKSGGLISDEKLLLKRILLSPDDEDHMPPKEKKQLSEDEINFLIWWVENGADFDHSLVDLNLPDSLEGILSTEEIFTENALIPSEGVEPAAEDVLAKLHNLGVVVTPVGAESDYLSVNFINVEKERVSAAAEAMTEIRKQVIFLNLDYQSLDQEAWDKIGLLINLRKLSARNSNLSDESISALQHLTELMTLNFVGTDLTVNGLLKIKNLNKLQSIYLYQTALNHQDFERTATAFPGVRLDSGNYMVPTWASDTLVFKK